MVGYNAMGLEKKSLFNNVLEDSLGRCTSNYRRMVLDIYENFFSLPQRKPNQFKRINFRSIKKFTTVDTNKKILHLPYWYDLRRWSFIALASLHDLNEIPHNVFPIWAYPVGLQDRHERQLFLRNQKSFSLFFFDTSVVLFLGVASWESTLWVKSGLLPSYS